MDRFERRTPNPLVCANTTIQHKLNGEAADSVKLSKLLELCWRYGRRERQSHACITSDPKLHQQTTNGDLIRTPFLLGLDGLRECRAWMSRIDPLVVDTSPQPHCIRLAQHDSTTPLSRRCLRLKAPLPLPRSHR
jgi:hypothetical protein